MTPAEAKGSIDGQPEKINREGDRCRSLLVSKKNSLQFVLPWVSLLHLQLQQIPQTSALIILVIMLNLIQ